MPSEAFQLPDDYQTALDQGWLPIRDVARQTGVNAVTLRAWERRYGLIVPGRTAKGHRLYNSEHVARIQAILTWLNRGVAVSQVNELLSSRNAVPQPQEHVHPHHGPGMDFGHIVANLAARGRSLEAMLDAVCLLTVVHDEILAFFYG